MENIKDFFKKINGALNDLFPIVLAAVSGWAAIRAFWYYRTERGNRAIKEIKEYGLVLAGILALKAFSIFCIKPILQLISS